MFSIIRSIAKMKIKLFFLFFFGFACANIFGQTTYTSNGTGGGNWSDPLTWDLGVPGSGDNVVIQATDAVTADAAATPINVNWIEIHGTLTINNGVSLTVSGCDGLNFNGENFTIDAAGTVTNNGTLSLDQGGCGGNPNYSDLAGGTFTNNSTFTIDDGGDYSEHGSFQNTGTINITSTSSNSTFETYVSLNNTGGTFNINNNSLFLNGLGGDFSLGNGTINMNAGSEYQHAQNGGTIPTCTWNSTSTCLVTGISGSVPAGLGQSFGNFTWQCTQSGTVNLNGALTTVTGDLTISDVGSGKTLQLATTTNPTINISGNLVINTATSPAGVRTVTFSTSGSPTYNITGNLSISSTNAKVFLANGNGSPTLNATDFTIASTAASAFTMSAGTGTATMNLTGNFSYTSTSSSLITETSSGKGKIIFKKNGTQTYSSTSVQSPFVNNIQITVGDGVLSTVLDMSASTKNIVLQNNGGGNSQTFTVSDKATLTTGTKTITTATNTTFTLASGSTLNTSNASGVNSTIVSGGTRTINNGASYIIGGASTGFTSWPTSTMKNLTLNATSTLDATITTTGTLLISAGTFSAGANTINAQGDFTNSSTFTANTGKVNFNGSALQTISGNTTTFNNIVINNAAGVQSNIALNISDSVVISSGTFTTNANAITLLSTAGATAHIGNSAGSITGTNWIIQRYIPASFADWEDLSTPISGNNISDWDNELYLSLSSLCPDGTAANWNSVYTFTTGTQTLDPVSNCAQALTAGMGFELYLATSMSSMAVTTMDSRGTPNIGNISSPALAGAGNFSLVGNPYAASIDWKRVYTDNGAKVANNFYIYDETIANYAYWDAATPANSTGQLKTNNDGIIPAHNAFWVTSTGGGNLSFKESHKSAINDALIKKTPPPPPANILTMRLHTDRMKNECTSSIKIIEGSNEKFDVENDLGYMKCLNKLSPDITPVSSDGKKTRIKTIPIKSSYTVPVTCTFGAPGEYTIDFGGIDLISAYNKIILEDKETGIFVPLHASSAYSFTQSNTRERNFSLHFYTVTNTEIPIENSVQVFSSEENIGVHFYFEQPTTSNVEIYSSLGQLVYNATLKPSSETILLPVSTSNQIYFVKVTTSEGTVTKKIFH